MLYSPAQNRMPTRLPDCDSHCPALLDFFLSSICSAMAFTPLGIFDLVVVSVSIPQNGMQRFIA